MYVTKASWNVVMRRLAEVTAAVMPLLALLAIPVIIFAGQIYGWADPEAASSHALAHKAAYLSQNAFIIRWVIYFVIWSGYSLFFWRDLRQAGHDRRPGADPPPGELQRLRPDALRRCPWPPRPSTC